MSIYIADGTTLLIGIVICFKFAGNSLLQIKYIYIYYIYIYMTGIITGIYVYINTYMYTHKYIYVYIYSLLSCKIYLPLGIVRIFLKKRVVPLTF